MRFIALFLLLLTAAPAFAAPVPHSIGRLYASLPQQERDYYITIFDYSMTHMRAKQAYEWKTTTASGSFTPDKPFEANGTVCRKFNETMSVDDRYSMASSGLACKRQGKEGWCRLRAGDAKTCAMEPPTNMWEDVLQAAEDGWSDVEVQGRNANAALRRGIDEAGRQGEKAGDKLRGGYDSVKRGARNVGDSISRGAGEVVQDGNDAAGYVSDTVTGWWPF